VLGIKWKALCMQGKHYHWAMSPTPWLHFKKVRTECLYFHAHGFPLWRSTPQPCKLSSHVHPRGNSCSSLPPSPGFMYWYFLCSLRHPSTM
jgi:uncharacterized membrane protein (DUF106 family)